MALEGWKRRLYNPGHHGRLLVSLGDNMSELLVFTVGRARDRHLNSLARQAAGLAFATDSRWARRHVPTDRNISDEDSRLADLGALRPGQRFEGKSLAWFLGNRSTRAPRAIGLGPPGPAFLELFPGTARLTSCAADSGLRVVRPFDIDHDPVCDFRNPRLQQTVLGWLTQGLVWSVWLGFPCTWNSVAGVDQKTRRRRRAGLP